MNEKKEPYWLVLILILGAGLRLWGISWGLPYEYQTEEYRIVKYALRMGGTKDLNPHMFIYPSLYLYFMLFLYGLYYIFGKLFGLFASTTAFAYQFIRDPSTFYLIGRMSESLYGLGVIFLTYLTATRIFNKATGLLSALLIATLPEFVNKGHMIKGDMAGIFLGMLFFHLVFRIYETGKLKYYVYSGITLGLAFSTKYYMAMMGIALPIIHFLRNLLQKISYLLIGLLLIPIFFIVGTPYAILSKEFIEEFQISVFAFGGGAGNFWENFDFSGYFHKFAKLLFLFLRMSDFGHHFWFGSIGVGLLGFLGLALLFLKRKEISFIFIGLFLSYLIIVSLMPTPMVGYLAPLFPLLAMLAAYFFFFCRTNKIYIRWLASILMFISLISQTGESLLVSYGYSLKDTRTISKEWIEGNMPSGKKVLMDLLPYSPPLNMTPVQIKRIYENLDPSHYKKDYFKLKLETAEEKNPSYEIFVIYRMAKELGNHPKHVAEAQKGQDLVFLKGNESDFKNLRKIGIEFIIVNSSAQEHAKVNNLEIAKFYEMLPQKSKLLKTFTPQTRLHPGPEIKIYQLSPSASPPLSTK